MTGDGRVRSGGARILFGGWDNLLRVLVTGSAAYIGLVTFLRISGKRTLSKMNAFDLVVTVALGSTLATVLLPSSPSLADGLLALALLIALQFAVAWTQVRSAAFRKLVKSEPTLLFSGGQFLEKAMREERVAKDEVIAAVRGAGAADLDDIAAVVLETDGTFSVLRRTGGEPSRSALRNVHSPDRPAG